MFYHRLVSLRAVRFFRSVYSDNEIRRQNRRPIARDLALYAGNLALLPVERILASIHRDDSQPIAFIVGTPRSGTTLLFQLIARYLEVGYPNNFVARHWIVPVVGTARYERRFRGTVPVIPLRSLFGGTEGAASPHEFSWFWQYRAEFGATDDLTDEELDRLPWNAIRRDLAALAGWHRRPYVFKSLNHVVYGIPRFAREIPQSRFIHIRRNPQSVLRSILACRKQRYGDPRIWWSIRPRDVDRWRDRSPEEQVEHQVSDICRAVEEGLRDVAEERTLVTSYEALVASPRQVLEQVAGLLGGVRLRDAGALDALDLTSSNRPSEAAAVTLQEGGSS
ncbi:MAG: sulfotransferase [Deltaproteobacteria bacterium]|nr:sulfotransferase [Deltaproteobacteria bacterium]